MSDHYVLAINPGSTSTKIAVYQGETLLFEKGMSHDSSVVAQYSTNIAQFPMRKEAILKALAEENFPLEKLGAVAGRGGKTPPLKCGAYLVTKGMIDFLVNTPIDDHASNLGAPLAFEIAAPLGIPAYIYDAVVVDELEDIARYTGVPQMTRRASCHVLNMRAVALKTAQKYGRSFQDLNFVVCHMGGGITATVISRGRMIDTLTDEEGAFSPERAGGVPCRQLVDLCFSGQYNRTEATKLMRGQGGLVAYLGTNSALEVEKRIAAGDSRAELVYSAMAYQTAKGIGGLATVLKGGVDYIVLTGALAKSARFLDQVKERIAFIAPLEIWPGEDELEALARGALRVLRGQEDYSTFTKPDRAA